MRHQSKNVFWGISVGFPQHQKGYLIYITSTQKIFSSHVVVFDKIFSSKLAYTSCQYSEAIMMRPSVSYIPYDTPSHEKTGNIITFAQF